MEGLRTTDVLIFGASAIVLVSVAGIVLYRASRRRGLGAGTTQRAADIATDLVARAPRHGSGRMLVLPAAEDLKGYTAATDKDVAAVAQLQRAAQQLAVVDARRKTAAADDAAGTEALLRELHGAARLEEPFERTSAALWGQLGFQGEDPATDFRGGGLLALDHFVAFARTHTGTLRRMVRFNKAQLAAAETSWFLTAVVSIQFTTSLVVREPGYDLTAAQREFLIAHPEGVEGGLRALHHQLLEAFFAAWQRDLPFVMEYNQWIGAAVLKPFFSSKWAPPSAPFTAPDEKKMQ